MPSAARTLVRHGKKLGGRIKELISIVSYSTFRKWLRSLEDTPDKRPKAEGQSGRPRVEESFSDLIIRIRKETGFGYTKILQELRRLGIHVSRQTVKNVLVDAGLGPEPQDHPDTWSEFLRRHAETMWQCDFACKNKWTIKGMVGLYFLVFIHIGSRRIWISPCTANPTGEWTAQQARNFEMYLEEENLSCEIIQRDRDTKYVEAFDQVFTSWVLEKGLAREAWQHINEIVVGAVRMPTLRRRSGSAYDLHLEHALNYWYSVSSATPTIISHSNAS